MEQLVMMVSINTHAAVFLDTVALIVKQVFHSIIIKISAANVRLLQNN